MGLLSFFTGTAASSLVRLPQGSFTMDRDGRIVVSTLPQNFPPGQARAIGQTCLSFFQSARAANLPLRELMVDYPALRLKARELSGGAIVFLSPRGLNTETRMHTSQAKT